MHKKLTVLTPYHIGKIIRIQNRKQAYVYQGILASLSIEGNFETTVTWGGEATDIQHLYNETKITLLINPVNEIILDPTDEIYLIIDKAQK